MYVWYVWMMGVMNNNGKMPECHAMPLPPRGPMLVVCLSVLLGCCAAPRFRGLLPVVLFRVSGERGGEKPR